MIAVRTAVTILFLVYSIVGNPLYADTSLATIFCADKIGAERIRPNLDLESAWTQLVSQLETRQLGVSTQAVDSSEHEASVRSCVLRYEAQFIEAEFLLKGREVLSSQIQTISTPRSILEEPSYILKSNVGIEGFGQIEIGSQVLKTVASLRELELRRERYAKLWQGFLERLKVTYAAPL